MAKASKKKSELSVEDFVPMKHTRAMLAEVWDKWRNSLGHTPDKAKRMMNAAIDELHKTETSAAKKLKATKKKVKTKVVKKAKAVKSKAKKKIAKI